MNYVASPWAVAIFFTFVASVLGISWYFARKGTSASGYFAAGGSVPWGINGVAFAGDYLSAASFLGICGMIATYGYDGFLYSIGYLAGWVVAMFVVAEPMKRLGKYTFTDALDAKFKSRGIRLMGAISTLLVSVFYLIPQMVGAGTLVTPLLGLPHEFGVVMVGIIVITIVATAGMASTTYVQFLKGGLLIVFSIVLVILLLGRGLSTDTHQGDDAQAHEYVTLPVDNVTENTLAVQGEEFAFGAMIHEGDHTFVRLESNGENSYWLLDSEGETLSETEYITVAQDGTTLYNGAPKAEGRFFQVGHMSELAGQTEEVSLQDMGLLSYTAAIKDSVVVRWSRLNLMDGTDRVTVFFQQPTSGREVMSPGLKYKVDSEKGATTGDKLNFISLMLALFCGTAALPHILIRYYTVKSPAAARKSTIVAIATIGLFYLLTFFMGLGAMTNGVLDPTNDNMAAPLLAKSFGVAIFAIISAIAFATVLGTVSGLIVAASGAVAHDLMDRLSKNGITDEKKVKYGKITAVGVGAVAIVLGIVFKSMNVSFLVGWAFAVAASANLPAIIMILFWKRTTAKGVIASITTGLVTSLGLILLSQETFELVYHTTAQAPMPISNPAIFSVPLSFLALVVVSMFTAKKAVTAKSENANAA